MPSRLRTDTMLKAKAYVLGLYQESKSSDATAIIESQQPERLACIMYPMSRQMGTETVKKTVSMPTSKDMGSIKGEIENFKASMRDVKNSSSIVLDMHGVTVEEALENLVSHLYFVLSHPGWTPERFDEVEDRLFCYRTSTLTFSSRPWTVPSSSTRLVECGTLACDDYGFTTCLSATDTFHAVLSGKFEAMRALPGDGGFLMKGRVSAEPDFNFVLWESSSSLH